MGIFRALAVALAASLAGGNAAAVDLDEMMADAMKKFRADIAKSDISLRKVAVYAIEPDREGKVNLNMVFDQMETALMDSNRFAVINRKSLKALLEEQALSLTGVVDEAQMVKAGKLVGAQGFFYGSVEAQKDKFILTVKLIEVESSAVVYSRKFTGESRSFARLGISYFFGTGSIGLDYQAYTKLNNDRTNLSPEPGQMDKVSGTAPLGGMLSYKQGFQAVSWAQLGLDLSFSHLVPSTEKIESEDGETATLVAPPGTSLTYGTVIDIYGATILRAIPKLYFSFKSLFGWENDWVNPYLAPTIEVFMIDGAVAGWLDFTGGYSHYQDYAQTKFSATSIAILPTIGAEFNLTKSLSAFAEAAIVASRVDSGDGTKNIFLPENLNFEVLGFLPAGPQLSFGIKYYFNLF